MLLWATAISTLNVPLALAGDLTISDSRSEPIDTATGDGEGPGTIIIDSSGSVQVGAEAAVTVNTDHNVTNNGTISNSGTGLSGILVDLTAIDPDTDAESPRNISSTVTNQGTITTTNPFAGLDDNISIFNAGIRVGGEGVFTGDIINDTNDDTIGTILIEGTRSYGIAVQGEMVGDVVNNGRIEMRGKSAFGVMTTGHITGNIVTGGTILARNHQGTGVYIGGGLDGTYTHTGSISLGTGSQLVSEDGFNLTRLPAILGRNGIWIASDITEGVLLQGNGFTLAEESEDSDLVNATPEDSSISVIGRGPGIFITPGGPKGSANDITIGARPDENGYSFVNRGNLLVSGTQGGVTATGFDIEGVVANGTTYTATLEGGFWNDGGDLRVSSLDNTATGMRIGDHGVVTSIRNDGDISIFTADSTARTIDNFIGELGGDGYGVLVEDQGTLNAFTNSGIITVDVQGPTASAYGIIDRSGTLSSFSNSGTIETVVPDGGEGIMLAVDLSANTTGGSFSNSGTIIGDVLLGAGNQSVSMTGGTLTGNLTFQAGAASSGSSTLTMDDSSVSGRISLGNGNHTVALTNGTELDGGLAHGTGSIDLSMTDSRLAVFDTAPLTVSQANIGANSTVSFDISGADQAAGDSLVNSAGQITFDSDARLTATVSGIVEGTQTYTVLKAGTLDMGAALDDLVAAPNSYMNNVNFSLSATDPNSVLLTVERKSAETLGLGPNASAIYNSFATALNTDKPVAAALSSLQTQEEFNAGIRQLLPDTSGATLQAALNNQDMGTGMIRRRLVAVAKGGMPDHRQGDVAGFWAQALGGYADQSAKGEQAGFSIWGLGIALGADMPVFDDNAHIGFSLMESWQSISLNAADNSPVEFYTTQLSLYGRHQSERFYTQAILTGAYNSYETERRVDFGGLERVALGDWDGYQWGGSLETGAFFRWNLYQLTPYVHGAYVNIQENDYTETGAGDGVNLIVGDKKADSFRGSVGFTFDRDFPLYYDSYLEAEFRANYSRDILNNPPEVTANFVAGDTPFTVMGNKRTPNRFNFGLGIAHKDSYSSVSLDYDAEIASGYISHTAAVTARFRF